MAHGKYRMAARTAVRMLRGREREGKGHGSGRSHVSWGSTRRHPLRSWVKQAEIDGGVRPWYHDDDKQRSGAGEGDCELRALMRS